MAKPGAILPPCPQGISKENMKAISAPYNFVPLADWVHIPAWSRQASHDLPFKDGCSGEIVYELIAHSPLLVGGKQQKQDGQPGEVRPFRLPGGEYAIPGSSLKGMLRAIIEIIGFGRMRMVDDMRPGMRDITGKLVDQSYIKKVKDNVRTGLMSLSENGSPVIVPCKMARMHHRQLEKTLNVREPIFRQGKSVKEKYDIWAEHARQAGFDPENIPFTLNGDNAQPDKRGAHTGRPVFTGQISDSIQKDGKARDFIFYAPDDEDPINVPDDIWRDFLHIHDNDKPDRNSMPWPDYWKARYRNGEEVPVFYLEDNNKLRIGLAFMPKLAGDFSIHQMLANSSESHITVPGLDHGYDLADLLFGAIGEAPHDALRGRVSCETAITTTKPDAVAQPSTILNGPKPTYFPNYVTQRANKDGKLANGQYATYIATQQSKSPTLRGFKRYPARPDEIAQVQALGADQKANTNVQVRLHTLPAATRFLGRIVYHNLKPQELGALLWAITWGGQQGLRHGLGMGKPFGFGQVGFELVQQQSTIRENQGNTQAQTLNEEKVGNLVVQFTQYMESVCKENNQPWATSPQINNLLAMAEPEAANSLPEGMSLRHMHLTRCQRGDRRENLNEYQWAKQKGFVLQDYATATDRNGGISANTHPWLLEQFKLIKEQHNITDEMALWGGKPLAEAWQIIDDTDTKATVLKQIQTFWAQQGWWDNPPKGAKRKAKTIYTGDN